jgi:hypothetical protein
MLSAAIVATLIAAFVVEENWRGDHDWAKTVAEHAARGESLDYATYRQPTMPDDQNLFKAPVIVALLSLRGIPANVPSELWYACSRSTQFLARSGTVDLAGIRETFRKSPVQAVVSTTDNGASLREIITPLDDVIGQIRAATTRASAMFEDPPLPTAKKQPNLGAFFAGMQVLQFHASANILARRPAEAFEDVRALIRIGNGMIDPSTTLMALLVGSAIRDCAAQSIQLGLARHVWDDRQLAEFQTRLLDARPVDAFARTMHRERAFFVSNVDQVSLFTGVKVPLPPRVMFHGWLQQNKVTLVRRFDQDLSPALGSNPERVFPERFAQLNAAITKLKRSRAPFEFVAGLMLSNFGGILDGLTRPTCRRSRVSSARSKGTGSRTAIIRAGSMNSCRTFSCRFRSVGLTDNPPITGGSPTAHRRFISPA